MHTRTYAVAAASFLSTCEKHTTMTAEYDTTHVHTDYKNNLNIIIDSKTSTCQKYAVMTAEYHRILVHTDNQNKNTDTARYTLWRLRAFYLHVISTH